MCTCCPDGFKNENILVSNQYLMQQKSPEEDMNKQ